MTDDRPAGDDARGGGEAAESVLSPRFSRGEWDGQRRLGFRGRIDQVEPGLMSGWAVIDNFDGKAELEIVADGTLLGVVRADAFRRDLAEAGIANGQCAFCFRPAAGVRLDPGKTRAFFKGTGIALRAPRGSGGAGDPINAQAAALEGVLEGLKMVVRGTIPTLEKAQGEGLKGIRDQADLTVRTVAALHARLDGLERMIADDLARLIVRTAAEVIRREGTEVRDALKRRVDVLILLNAALVAVLAVVLLSGLA